jgi:hypothetical protein
MNVSIYTAAYTVNRKLGTGFPEAVSKRGTFLHFVLAGWEYRKH